MPKIISLLFSSLILALPVQADTINYQLEAGRYTTGPLYWKDTFIYRLGDSSDERYTTPPATNSVNDSVPGLTWVFNGTSEVEVPLLSSVNIYASTSVLPAVTPNIYQFIATGGVSCSPTIHSSCSAKAMVNCTIDPAGYWSYVSPSLLGFEVNNPYDPNEFKTIVFEKPMHFIGTFAIDETTGKSVPPSFKAFIQGDGLICKRTDGTQSTGYFSVAKAGETYVEFFRGTVEPGTYTFGAAAVYYAYSDYAEGQESKNSCKGTTSFTLLFSPKSPVDGSVELIEGAVTVLRNGMSHPLIEGGQVSVGDVIETAPNSAVNLAMADKSQLKLESNSSIKVQALKENSPSVISLIEGNIQAKVVKSIQTTSDNDEAKYYIQTRNGGAAVRGAEFKMSYSEMDGMATSKLDVIQGVVDLVDYHQGEIVKVTAGQSASIVNSVEKVATPSLAPEIAVYDSKSRDLIASKSTVKYGRGLIGGKIVKKSFKIKNIWTANLSDIKLQVRGKHAADFKIISRPSGQISGGAGTDFLVAFKPRAQGPRTAKLRILSNDANESPFDIILVGTGYL